MEKEDANQDTAGTGAEASEAPVLVALTRIAVALEHIQQALEKPSVPPPLESPLVEILGQATRAVPASLPPPPPGVISENT